MACAGAQEAAQSRHSEHRSAVTDTNTFQNILNWSFGGRCDTASNICLFPREQQHSGLIIKQHRSSEFEKVP